MFDIPLRALKDHLTQPISRFIPSFVSPNHITLLAFIFGLLACYFSAFPLFQSPYLPVSLWLTNRLLDCLDGSVARLRNIATETGGFLDLLSDFVVYSLIPISVAWGMDSAADWRAIAVLEATFHINNFILFYIAAVASKKGSKELTSVTMTPALVEGFESGVIFTLMLARPAWSITIARCMSVAVIIGIVQRVMILLPVLNRLDTGKEGIREEVSTKEL